MVEMAVFGLLVIPLPFSVKRKLFTYVFPALPIPGALEADAAHGCDIGGIG